jgi:hypothetical protein
MKQTFILLSFLFVAFIAIGQKRISEGVISYDIVINTGTGKPRAADFFDGATSTVYLKEIKAVRKW